MGELIPFRPDGARSGLAESEQETHYEVTLDEEPAPDAVLVQASEPVRDRHPIIPAELRGWSTIKATVQHTTGRWAHQTGSHAVRAPRYALLGCFWAGVGVFRLTGRRLRWWWVTEQYGLRQGAADRNDPEMWMKLHREVKATRAWRGLVLLGEAIGVAMAAGMVVTGPTWLTVTGLVGAIPALAHVGRPSGRRIISPAVVTPRFRTLNPDIVLRAYYAAKLGDPDRPGQQVHFGTTKSRDGNGSLVLIDLSHGKGLNDSVKAKPAIASGLDVSLSQVFIT